MSSSFQEYAARAEQGDPDAQIWLAWQYAEGKRVPKDVEKSERLFREAERKKPALARFYLAKAKTLNDDKSFKNDILEDSQNGFAPALYLLGCAAKQGLLGRPDTNEAVRYFSMAADRGHLVSEAFVWRLEKKNPIQWLVTLPRGLSLLAKVVVAKIKTPYDVRVLT